eukprot:11175425-Lingulodinium_polyedra.AAC.1
MPGFLGFQTFEGVVRLLILLLERQYHKPKSDGNLWHDMANNRLSEYGWTGAAVERNTRARATRCSVDSTGTRP